MLLDGPKKRLIENDINLKDLDQKKTKKKSWRMEFLKNASSQAWFKQNSFKITLHPNYLWKTKQYTWISIKI